MILYHSLSIFIYKYFRVSNYLINETQLRRILETIEVEKEMSLRDAMRKIVSVLRDKGFDEEQIVDFMIAIRQKDPYTKILAQDISKDEEFQQAIRRLLLSV